MDKNNDIQVNKVDKWDAAPESIKKLNETISFLFDRLEVKTYNIDDPEYKELVDEVFKGLDKALDDYNELEARHQKDAGMISEYEEENRDLKSELDIKTDECDALISRVFKQDDEYTKLESVNEELRSKCESKDDALKQMIHEVAELEKEKIDLEVRLTHLIMVEHDKLLIKYEKLKDENISLRTDNKRLSNAVNAWFDMFNDMRHKRDDLKKEYEKLKETNKSLSCPVACECENFKPKVHHSYDPLDDLPDMEHS